MKLSKKLIVAGALIALASSASALDKNIYLGAKVGALSTNTSVYANENGETSSPTYIKHDDFNLAGIEFQMLNNLESNFLMWGFGVDVLFNDGDFVDGGIVDADLKFGMHHNDLNVYGMLGVGIHSLSSYTVATGLYYGVGVNYNLAKHIGVKVEYKKYDMETTSDDDTTSNQTYELSGFLAGINYKF